MTVVQRSFGKRPSVQDSLPRGKQFTDQAMEVGIQPVLLEARYARKIGRTVADMCGERMRLEGDGSSKQLVAAAYDAVYDVISPTLVLEGAETTRTLFQSETTHRTLIDLSRTVDSYQFSKLTHEYRTQGKHLQVTSEGLEPQDTFVLTEKMEARRGGCPYAHEGSSSYFTKFSDHIVDTYVEAHTQGMPHGWLERINRSVFRR